MEGEKLLNKINIVNLNLRLVDSFVALGGASDGSGAVRKTVLIETIKR